MDGVWWPRPSRGRRLLLLTAGYVAVLLGLNIWVECVGTKYEQHVLAASSTDVWHLSHDPWRVIPESLLWTHRFLPYWLLAVVVGVGLLERAHGPLVAFTVAVVGQVLATAISEGVVAARLGSGGLPPSDAHLLDIGPSYVVVATATTVLATTSVPRAGRLASAAVLLPLAGATAWRLPEGHVDAIGHVVAAVVGLGAARLVGQRQLGAEGAG